VRGFSARVEGVQRFENDYFVGFLLGNVSKSAQIREKPEKTCGNRRKPVDKASGKAEGELRYGSPHPHEH
jgi:hypothetical protein